MGIFLRKLWKNKPKQWGPWKAVHAALIDNAEKFYGIDSSEIILALPMWSTGDQKDYSKNNISCTNSAAVFTNNSLNFVASNDSNILIPSFGVNNILSSLEALTFVQIARPNTQTTSSDQAILGSWGDTQILVWFDAGNDVWQVAIRDTTSDQITVQPGLIQPTGKKDTIIGMLKGNEFSLHVNGIFGGSDSVASFGVVENTTDPIAIGASYEAGIARPFDGTIDLTVILKTSINSSQTGLFSENPWQLWQPVPQKTIFLPGDAGGGTTVTGTTGAVVIAGINASVSAGTATTITATTGSVSISGISANISAGDTISVTTGAAVIQGVNASVSAGATITAATGAISINGITATVTNDGSITVTTGALVIQGITSSISAGTTITISTGAVVVQGFNATVENIRTVTATTGSVSITGINVEITSSVVIDVDTGAVIILGFDTSIQSGPTAVTPPERIYNIPKTNRVNTIKATRRVYTIT